MTTTTIPYEILIRKNRDGSIAGGMIRNLIETENGQVYEGPQVNFTDTMDPAYAQFKEDFSAETVAENELLKSEKTTLLSEKATLTQEKSALESQVASLTAQLELKTEQVETLTSEKADLTSSVSTLTQEKSALTSQVSSLTSQLESRASQVESLTTDKVTLTESLSTANARITFLLNEVPFNPREISVTSFKARLFKVLETEDVIKLYANETDPILEDIAKTITEWKEEDPIRLDSQELLQPLGYLVSIELLTPEEIVFLRKDCTRQEAYFPPENS